MRRSRQGKSLAHNEGNTFFFKASCLRRTSQTLPAVLFFTAIAYKQNRIVAINETQTLILCLQVERARSKMLCVVNYIFNLLCSFNCLQPMKKIVFSVASRATGRLQIKPSGSGDENVAEHDDYHPNKNILNKFSFLYIISCDQLNFVSIFFIQQTIKVCKFLLKEVSKNLSSIKQKERFSPEKLFC